MAQTDDLDFRDSARDIEVQAVGTIGLIVRAATTGVVEVADARRGLDALLTESSLFITKALVERAKAALE